MLTDQIVPCVSLTTHVPVLARLVTYVKYINVFTLPHCEIQITTNKVFNLFRKKKKEKIKIMRVTPKWVIGHIRTLELKISLLISEVLI